MILEALKPSRQMWDKIQGLGVGQVKTGIMVHFFTTKGPAPWNSFPREAADPPSGGLFTSRLRVKDAPIQPQVTGLRQASRGEILRPVLSRMSDEIIVNNGWWLSCLRVAYLGSGLGPGGSEEGITILPLPPSCSVNVCSANPTSWTKVEGKTR